MSPSDNAESVVRQASGLIVRNVSKDKIIIFSEATSIYTCLNSTGSEIWKLLRENTTPLAIVHELSGNTNFSSEEDWMSDVYSFLSELQDNGLIDCLSHSSSKQTNKDLAKTNTSLSFFDFINFHAERYIPATVVFELTYRCNERCVHCYEDCPETKGQRDLGTSAVKDILKQLKDLGTFCITFTGGEPTLRADWLEILAYAKSLNFSVILFTNATRLTRDDAIAISKLCIKSVHVSLYSCHPQSHNQITRSPGSHEATMRGIHLLREQDVSVTLKCPIMKPNQAEYESLKRLAQELSCELQLSPVISARDNGDLTPQALMLDDQHLEMVLLDPLSRTTSGVFDQYDNKTDSVEQPLCSIFFSGLAISANGQVYPCNQLKLTIGDTQKQSLHEIWYESEILEWLRSQKIKNCAGCSNCSMVQYCHRCPGHSFLETGSVLLNSRLDCRIAAIRQRIGILA